MSDLTFDYTTDPVVVAVADARSTAITALERAGVGPQRAVQQAEALVDGDLCGHPSHGLMRLPLIIKRIVNGRCDPAAVGHHEWASSSVLRVDGQDGLGPVVAHHAVGALLQRASVTGIAAAYVRNSNHLGMLAHYVRSIAQSGYPALAFTTSEALVHPWGGAEPLLGTNPLAIAVPAQPDPLVVDLATSVVSMGKVRSYAERGISLEVGWALDATGRPTTVAAEAIDGALSPFGPKGYALGLAIEAITATLTSSALGSDIKGTLDAEHRCTKGDVFVVFGHHDAAARVGDYLDTIRRSRPLETATPVRVPGDRAESRRRRQIDEGLSLSRRTWTDVIVLAGGVATQPTQQGSL